MAHMRDFIDRLLGVPRPHTPAECNATVPRSRDIMSVVSQSFLNVRVSSHKSYHKEPTRKSVKILQNFGFATAVVTLLPAVGNIGIRTRPYRKNGVRIRRRLKNGGVSPHPVARSAQDHLVYNIGPSGGLSR